MDIIEHFRKNNHWWFKIIFFSFCISLIFPVMMYKDKSQTYNVITNSLGHIIGGLVLFVIPLVISKIINKSLNEKQIKITLFVCFSFWWSIQIMNHFNIKLN